MPINNQNESKLKREKIENTASSLFETEQVRDVLPELSEHFVSRTPSATRLAQIEFMKRMDQVEEINTAIGNVSLPIHPAMEKRLFNLGSENSPFKEGVVKYTSTVGLEETRRAFLNIIASSGFSTEGLYTQITDGGSQAMELVILGVCGPAGSNEKPLLLIDAAYANYYLAAQRLGRKTVSFCRYLQENGIFTLPDITEIIEIIEQYRPGGLLIIPYDNPTGQFYDKDTLRLFAGLCVKYNMWMISDEAYRELYYVDKEKTSIWGLTDREVPGIEGRRMSIESASKVWNACGLRTGALITDNREFHEKAVAENTFSLCPNAIGQYIFGALAHESHVDLKKWYKGQTDYYKRILTQVNNELKQRLPGIIVSSPQASIYSVIDVRNIAKPHFDALEFVLFCARRGNVKLDKKSATLLVAPMSGFYKDSYKGQNPGKSQMRIAYVETPERMELVPHVFAELFKQFEAARS